MRRRPVLVVVVLVALVVGIFVLIGGPRQGFQAIEDSRALAALPQVPIAPMLRLSDGAPDLVVFEDSRSGWFELDIAALPHDLEIGFFGPRLIDMFTGNNHLPINCGGGSRPGKTIWAIRDGQIADSYAFCNPRRMDLGPLRPYASPVEMVSQRLSRSDILALTDAIAQDNQRAIVALPPTISDNTHRVVLTPPLMWYIDDVPPARHQVENAMEATIRTHMGNVDVHFRRRPNSNPNLTFGGINGMAIQQDGQLALVPGVWGEPYEIWIECLPDACALAQTLDLEAEFAQGRNLSGLRRALRGAITHPDATSPTPIDYYPTLDELEADQTDTAEPQPITYDIRFIQRP